MYSEKTLTDIRERLGIVELVGEYVELKKSGQGHLGLCPFHNEKSPSFHVHPLKQCFHCFGCQKGGNIFTFLGAMEGLSFPESVQRLAKRTGVEIEEYRGHRPRPEPQADKRLVSVMEWAAKYFHYLLKEVPEYRFARKYLEGRGLTDKTIDRFRIGVAPKGWNTLLSLMQKRNYRFEELVEAGLVIPKEGSPTQGYDRFRERLMFPITNPDGAVIGFGGRQLDNAENQPKYINSPESPIFSKRKILYAFHENQRGIRLKGEALIVEGYMDVVGLYEAGVQNAVATMGTALTEDHCYQLKSITQRVVTVFDPDAAGTEAWRRSVSVFLASGIFAKDLKLPDGKDPDEYVLKEGAEAFYRLCEKAPRQVTKLLKEIAERGPLSEEETARTLSELTPVLMASRRLPDRAFLWDDISLVLKTSVAALKELTTTTRPGEVKQEDRPAPSRLPAKTPAMNMLDQEFFQACLKSPVEFRKLPPTLWKGALKERKLEAWLDRLLATTDQAQWESRLEDLIHTEEDPRIVGVASASLFGDGAAGGASLLPDFLERLKARKKELEIKALSTQVRLTQRMGNEEEQIRLLARLNALRSN